MKIEIDPKKSVEQNAADYYNKGKKYKKKLEGLKKAVEDTEKLITKAELEESEKKVRKKVSRKKEWFERFHWLKVKNSLVIGGRDAKSNELLVKRHMEKEDLFFHADVHGATAIIAKKGQELSEEDLEKIAVFAGCFSNAWKAGRGTVDVYCVKPDQVTTAAKSGEYLSKGSFVIEGERKYFKNVVLKLEITFEEGKLAVKPFGMIKGKKIILKPDSRKTKGETSKTVFKKLKELFPDEQFNIDWVQELLPNGGSRVS